MRPTLAPFLLLALAACSVRSEGDEDAAKPVALVTTAAVVRGSIEETLTAYGAAEFALAGERTLAAPVEAVVVKVAAAPGAVVSAGQAIVTLAPSPGTRLELDKARGDAETTAAAFARAQRLRASGLDSDADVETARAAAVVAKTALATMQARTGAALAVRAPAAGVVETLTAAPGDLVAAGVSLGKLGSLSAVSVRLGVDPQSISRIHLGAHVALTPVMGGLTRAAVVTGLDPRIDSQTRLAGAIIAGGAGFAPGQPLAGDIVVEAHQGVAILPRSAVLYEQDQPYVFVVAKGVAHRRDISIGVSNADRIEVVRGLVPGERIAVDGTTALDDGMAVREAPATRRSTGGEQKGASNGGAA